MATSHCREVIDDHMNDSNWKKLVDLGKLHLTVTEAELTEIMQSALYQNTTTGRFLEQISVQ